MFKLIGPVSHTHSHGTHGEQTRLATYRHIIVWLPQVLVKQELMEVRNNVQKRVEFIKSDIKRLEGIVKNYEKQMETVKGNIAALQKSNKQ